MTKEKFQAYVSVQKEGLTNMFNIPAVIGLALKFSEEELTKEDCFDIEKNYTEYKKKFDEADDEVEEWEE